jgi:hypothetical protein
VTRLLLVLACVTVTVFVITLMHARTITPPWAYLPGRCTVATTQFAVASVRGVEAPRITFSGTGAERYCERVEQVWQGRRVSNPTEDVSGCKWTYDDEVTAFVWSPQDFSSAGAMQIAPICSHLASLRP